MVQSGVLQHISVLFKVLLFDCPHYNIHPRLIYKSESIPQTMIDTRKMSLAFGHTEQSYLSDGKVALNTKEQTMQASNTTRAKGDDICNYLYFFCINRIKT